MIVVTLTPSNDCIGLDACVGTFFLEVEFALHRLDLHPNGCGPKFYLSFHSSRERLRTKAQERYSGIYWTSKVEDQVLRHIYLEQ